MSHFPTSDGSLGGSSGTAQRGWLDRVERLGNRLPEPALLFVLLCGLVVVISAIGAWAGWQVQPVQPRVVQADAGAVEESSGRDSLADQTAPPKVELIPQGVPIVARSLASSEGVYWMLSSMLRNFTSLPALGLIFVAMLGIGLAEKFGFFSALMRRLALVTPRVLLTPTIVFLGANASVASDAGYIVLPPLAAALYGAMGRSPVAGLAAAFAGVSGGFGAGLFPTGGDGALAGFAQDAAHVIDPGYSVHILHNLYFKAGSVVVITLAGWWVTDRWIEPRLARSPGDAVPSGTSDDPSQMALTSVEKRALRLALVAMAGVLAGFAFLVLMPGMPLHGRGLPSLPDGRVVVHHSVSVGELTADASSALNPAPHDVLTRDPLVVAEVPVRARLVEPPGNRWSHVIVPVIFLTFLVPGLVYGWSAGTLRTQRDVVDGLSSGIRSIVPVLVIAFFMGQFVNYFAYTRLDRMLAYSGGAALVRADLPPELLLGLLVLLVVLGDFAISGMLSKFGVLAPVIIPMLMMVGISPELTTAAYRIGDSVVNIVTPLNSYLLIILAVLQRYQAGAGLGSLISLMLPYSLVFGVSWTAFLLFWYMTGFPLGPESPLEFRPAR